MTDDGDDLRRSVEHLQAAAREVISATRSLLDAAEDLVDDPAAIQGLVGTLGSLASAAAERLRSEGGPFRRPSPGRHHDGDGPDDGGVQHIRVS